MSPTGAVDASLVSFLRIIRQGIRIVVAITLVVTGGVIALDHFRTPIYEATAEVEFVSQAFDGAGAVTPLQPTDIETDVTLAESSKVRSLVEKALHRNVPIVSVTQIGQTDIADVSVDSPNARFATEVANAYVNAFIFESRGRFLTVEEQAESPIQTQYSTLEGKVLALEGEIGADASNSSIVGPLQEQLNSYLQQETGLSQEISEIDLEIAQAPAAGSLVQSADIPTSPASPNKILDAILAFIGSLVAASGLVIARDRFDDTIRDKEDLINVLPNVPILGTIPDMGRKRDARQALVVAHDANSRASEAIRILRTSIRFINVDTDVKTLLVTSPMPGEGKTTISANLAVAAAQAGLKVILVGCDLRNTSTHYAFGIANDVGFTSVLLGEVALDRALVSFSDVPNLQILPAGPKAPNPSELLGSAVAVSLIKELRDSADLILFDSAPLLPVADSTVLAGELDGTLLVVASNQTKRGHLERAIDLLQNIGAPIGGIVFNRTASEGANRYYRYYPYHSSDSRS